MAENLEQISSVFFGTDEFSVVVLEELQKAGFTPACIITAPDKARGRGMKLTPSPVKVWAQKNSIEFLQPESLNPSFVHNLKIKPYDVFVVASYGKILPKDVLEIPKYGTLNVHPSLLPLYRGPSPIQSQILDDVEMAGVTIMRMDEKIDHGPIIAQEVLQFPISNFQFPKLRDELAKLGGKLLARTIPSWIDDNIDAQEQDHHAATYTKQIKKEDGLVDVEKDDSEVLHRKFRAYDPWPGIYFFKNGKRIKITDAELKSGTKFIIKKIIPEGKKEMSYYDFIKHL